MNLPHSAWPNSCQSSMSSGTTCTCRPAISSVVSGPHTTRCARMVRIARIRVRIIVSEFHFQARIRRQLHRRRVAVLFLPVEIPVANPDQPLLASIGQDGPAFHLFADVMRVRDNAHRLDIHGRGEVVAHLVRALARRNVDLVRSQRDVRHPLSRRLIGEVKPQRRIGLFPACRSDDNGSASPGPSLCARSVAAHPACAPAAFRASTRRVRRWAGTRACRSTDTIRRTGARYGRNPTGKARDAPRCAPAGRNSMARTYLSAVRCSGITKHMY